MLRALILTALICICGILPSLAAVEGQPSAPTHNDATTIIAHSMDAANMIPQQPNTMKATTDEVIDSNVAEEDNKRHYYYHPAEDKKPHVIEEYNHRYSDGTYEFKYVLSNGVTRYEKSYWKPYGKGKKLLARKGFYSHPQTNGKYLTVFYTADEKGFQQNTVKYTSSLPTLPKHLDIPQLEFPKEASKPHSITTTPYMTTRRTTTSRTTATRKPTRTTTAKPLVEPTKFNWIY